VYDVFVKTTKTKYTWPNYLIVSGHSSVSSKLAVDTSTNGINPDPNGDNDPLEKELTKCFVNNTIPNPPVVNNATYIFNVSTIPATLKTLVKSYPTASVPAWCDLKTALCDTVPPAMPKVIGLYIYALKSYDTTSTLYSNTYTYDTVLIKPAAPTVMDSTYIVGLATNPANNGVQVTTLSGAATTYYALGVPSSVTPLIPNVAGTYNYTVSQTVNKIESDTSKFKVTMVNLNDVIHLQKIIDSGVLQANSTFNYPVRFVVTNLTKYPMSNVIVTDDLHNSVPLTSDYSVVSKNATGGLIVNNTFDANVDTKLTTITSGLAPYAKDTSRFMFNLNPKGYSGTLTNIGYVTAKTIWGNVLMASSADTRVTEIIKAPTKYYVPSLEIIIPEGYSPNYDGVNDYFVIIKPYNIKLELEVFNRWGNIVYTNNNYNNEWNGKGTNNFLGQDLVDGGYYYTLRAVDDMKNVRVFKGYVIIQR
jgi:gliding motility-associated-like protein